MLGICSFIGSVEMLYPLYDIFIVTAAMLCDWRHQLHFITIIIIYMFNNIEERVVFLFHVLIEFTVIAGKIVICLRDEK